MSDNNVMEELLKNLNQEQLNAVTSPSTSTLVLAGAGSGKTRVLTTRIAYLLQNRKVRAGQIMAVTFTRKASREMKNRIAQLLPNVQLPYWVDTFHALCKKLLNRHYQEAGLPQKFFVLSASEQLTIIRRLLKVSQINNEMITPLLTAEYINRAKESGLRAGYVHPQNNIEEEMARIYALYEQMCQREGAVDFAELLLRTCELLERNQIVREFYQEKFQHILVDEFQDTNDLQYRWLKLLSGKDTSVFVVGDDDQSIYGFRGANVTNMKKFIRDFKVSDVIKLEQNYRSFGHILKAANHLIAHNTDRLGKNLRTNAGDGTQIQLFNASDDSEEIEWIVNMIGEFIRSGISPKEIAVLYRANSQSQMIERALSLSGIHYIVYGGTRFYEREEVLNTLSYLHLLFNLDNNTAFIRAVKCPSRGIGEKTLEQLQDIALEKQCSCFAAIDYFAGRNKKQLVAFRDFILQLKNTLKDASLTQLFSGVIEQSGLITYYESQKGGEWKADEIRQLVVAAQEFVRSAKLDKEQKAFEEIEWETEDDDIKERQSPLGMFLAQATLEGSSDAEEQDGVQLMTVHLAKGLEFDVVFIAGLEEGMFPHSRALQEINGVTEERRLMYVAMTRAKKVLLMSLAKSRRWYNRFMMNAASRFVDELPLEQVEWLTRPPNSWQQAPREVEKPKPQTAKQGFSVGQYVEHNKFGKGLVIALDGKDSPRVFVKFDSVGVKQLDVTIAKLTPLN